MIHNSLGKSTVVLGLAITFYCVEIYPCFVKTNDNEKDYGYDAVIDNSAGDGQILGQLTEKESVATDDDEAVETQNFHQPHSYGVLHTLNGYRQWAAKEEHLVEVLVQRMELIESEIQLIKRYLKDYDKSTGETLRNLRDPATTAEARGQVVGKSVLLGHHMTQRYTTELQPLRQLLSSPERIKNEDLLYDILHLDNNKTQEWVNIEDMFMSMTMFLTLQDVNHFSPAKLRKGLEYDTQAGGELTPTHCTEIGIFALYRKRYFISVEWLELAQLVKVLTKSGTQGGHEISLNMISLLLQVSTQHHNRILADIDYESEILYQTIRNVFLAPVTLDQSPQDRVTYRSYEIEHFQKFTIISEDADDNLYTQTQFEELCQGKKIRTPAMETNLRCYYENKRHPYLYLNPVKAEVLSENPPVFQLYEMIGNKANTNIQNEYVLNVKPSEVVGSVGMEDVSEFRTSVGIGMHWKQSEKKLYSLGEFVTGLKIWGNSEHTQYAEYTYGRYYTYHVDMLESNPEMAAEVKKYGDRLITMLYYLELPESGGLTPFCQGGFWAHPERGSAIVWYNMYRNGSARKNVDHGSCPVIHGHKIIMNHWVHYYGNWKHYRCSLNQYE